ncbi:Na+/H+ antiporter NhaC family protein [Dysosmobacter sp.]
MSKDLNKTKKYGFAAFIPMLVFLGLYLGCGLYYTITGTVEQPWNQFPRHAAILVGIVVAFIMNRTMPLPEKVKKFCCAAGDEGTIMMCMIFLVAGAFSGVCKAMGGVDSVVNLGLSLVPAHFILPGIFVITALVATAIGTSSGALVAIAPIALAIAESTGSSIPLYFAAVYSGALFGDNLSIISDTTIAATTGAGCEMKDKFRMNLLIALPAALVTAIAFAVLGSSTEPITGDMTYSLLKIIPYVYVLVAAICGMDVFVVLISGTFLAGLMGIFTGSLTIAGFAQAIGSGMSGMMATAIVAILLRGLIGIITVYGGIDWLVDVLHRRVHSRKGAEYCIGIMSGVLDFALINNTIAIMIAAPIAKDIADEHHIAPKRNASLLDIFACAVHGLAPHAGGMLTLSGFYAALNPLAVVQYNFYCYFLIIATVITIQFGLLRTPEEKEYIRQQKEAVKH